MESRKKIGGKIIIYCSLEKACSGQHFFQLRFQDSFN